MCVWIALGHIQENLIWRCWHLCAKIKRIISKLLLLKHRPFMATSLRFTFAIPSSISKRTKPRYQPAKIRCVGWVVHRASQLFVKLPDWNGSRRLLKCCLLCEGRTRKAYSELHSRGTLRRWNSSDASRRMLTPDTLSSARSKKRKTVCESFARYGLARVL